MVQIALNDSLKFVTAKRRPVTGQSESDRQFRQALHRFPISWDVRAGQVIEKFSGINGSGGEQNSCLPFPEANTTPGVTGSVQYLELAVA